MIDIEKEAAKYLDSHTNMFYRDTHPSQYKMIVFGELVMLLKMVREEAEDAQLARTEGPRSEA